MEEAKGLKDLERADVVHFVSKILSGRAEVGQLSASANSQHKPLKQDMLRRKKRNPKGPTGVRLMCRTSMMVATMVAVTVFLCSCLRPGVPTQLPVCQLGRGVYSDSC